MSGAADRLNNAAVIKKITPVFTAKGIPSWLWMPIAARESGFNPGSTANNASELSKGLFQINVKAHPQYLATDLYDPVTNATIARDVFIGPAYEIAKTITSDPRKQALIVYSGLKNPESLDTGAKPVYIADGGIRPKWTTATRDAFLGYYDQYAGPVYTLYAPDKSIGGTDNLQPGLAPVEGQGSYTAPGGTGGAGGIGMTAEGVEGVSSGLTGKQEWGKVGVTVGVVLVVAVAGFMMIKGNTMVGIMQKVGQGG